MSNLFSMRSKNKKGFPNAKALLLNSCRKMTAVVVEGCIYAELNF